MVWAVLFSKWAFFTGFGKKALARAPVRRNKMTIYAPFVPLLIWILVMWVLTLLVTGIFGEVKDARLAAANNFVLGISAVIGAAVILYIAKKDFVRGIKGFGLSKKRIAGDLWKGFVALLAVWPLVVLGLYLTQWTGQIIWGGDFQINKHRELNMITEYADLKLWILIFIVAAGIVPFFEEMLFRGMFQSMIRAYTDKVWWAIILCSIIFTTVHPDVSHWAGLFVLSIGLGYVYERTGSLWAPVFMHSLFNAVAVISTIATVK